jgi:hypothetical protein
MRVLSFDVGTKNLAFCDLTVLDTSFSISKWTVESCVPSGLNVNETALVDLVPYFTDMLRRNMDSWASQEYDMVLIENQPMGGRGSARNLKTKVLSHILQAMFLDRDPKTKIQFVHPGLKLKDMPRTEEKSTYRANKFYAITKTTELIGGSECTSQDLASKVMSTKKMKKDDLADAFLQGFYFARMYLKGEIQEQVKAPVSEKPKTKKKPKAINLDEPLEAEKPDLANLSSAEANLVEESKTSEKKPRKPRSPKVSEPVDKLDDKSPETKDEVKTEAQVKEPKAEKKRKRAE